ncbi:MAG: hypothetical protein KDF59_07810 [Nitrosomonas sp.]|nr:hypothetical protein [Nitrosomonas sp.]
MHCEYDKDPSVFVAEQGGSYAFELGIDLENLKSEEIYKWFLAALLYGAHISEKIAKQTWQVLRKYHVMSPEQVINAGWDRLVSLLDEGGYTRYDFKTATKLLSVNQSLLHDYGGNLNQLHEAATDARDLERRIMRLGKGIGKVTTQIFLCELREKWAKAMPPLSPLAIRAAQFLKYLPDDTVSNTKAIDRLQKLWIHNGQQIEQFTHFESALVRYGLNLRRHDLIRPSR